MRYGYICWSASMCRRPQDNVAYDFVLIARAVSRMLFSSTWYVWWDLNLRKAPDLWGVASRICSEQIVAFLCSCHLTFFFSCISLVPMRCILRVVLSQAQLWKNPIFILPMRSDFHIIDNLSAASHAFASRMLTSLSVEEMLLPRYMI